MHRTDNVALALDFCKFEKVLISVSLHFLCIYLLYRLAFLFCNWKLLLVILIVWVERASPPHTHTLAHTLNQGTDTHVSLSMLIIYTDVLVY